MCGIFAYIGNKENAANIALEGLKILEYRGYDSWGVAVKNGSNLVVDKHVGKIGNATVTLSKSNLAIGHTRWATHGGVTVANSHPHLDCKKEIAVVHNGIVENYEELKNALIKKGHKFVSETDTEIIPHLIEENLKTEASPPSLRSGVSGRGFATAVRKAFSELRGLNAIVASYAPSSQIVAVKNGSPLVVGIGANELYLASDISSFIEKTRRVIFLKDNEMVILGADIELVSAVNGKQLEIKPETVTWKFELSTKGTYPHFMIKEIYEQSTIIRNIANTYEDEITALAKLVKQAKGTFFIGAGTAFNAGLTGVYLFSKIAGMHINSALASEFNYLEHFLTKESLVIALSQSGETIDVIEPLNRARAKGSKIVAITNVLGSSIYRMADFKILLGAGPEKAVASTKAYIAKLAVLFMLVFGIVGKTCEVKKLLLASADEIDRILEKKNADAIKKIAKTLSKSSNIYVIGRGTSFPSALEAALKMKEITYIPTEGLAGGELKHGTIALISKGTPVIVFAPNDDTQESIISNAIEIKSRGGVIIGLAPKNHPAFDYFLEVKDIQEASYIAQIVAIQLLAYYMAVELKLDPDKPRNLAKSVTVK